MQISLRSHLIAGTAAVVGASAIAMTPVMGAQLSLPTVSLPTIANVSLAGLDSPISELLGTLILAGEDLFNTTYYLDENGDPNPAFLDRAIWGPTAFPFPAGLPNLTPPYDQTGTSAPVFPVALENDALGAYTSVGLIPNFIDSALPSVRQLGINGSDYLATSIFGLSGAGIALSEGVWNAVGELLTLNIPGALTTLANSISAAGTLALASGAYVLGGVYARAQAVASYLLGSVPLLLGSTVAQISLVVNKTIGVITDTVTAGSFEGAWNAAIDGIFGATGIPGTLLNITVGPGQQTAAIPYGPPPTFEPTEASIQAAYVPSVRTELQSLQVGLANALATANPISPPSAASVRSAAAARSAASVRAAAEAPAAEAPAAEAPAAEAPAAESSAPVKHRTARAVAKRASANN